MAIDNTDEQFAKEVADTAVRADAISRTMSLAGFVPRESTHPDYVEYAKSYVTQGTAVRVTALVDQGMSGVEDNAATLGGFVVTIQYHVEPREEEIKKRAPQSLQNDLVAIVQALGNLQQRIDLVKKPCSKCKDIGPDFFIKNDDGIEVILCPKCVSVQL